MRHKNSDNIRVFNTKIVSAGSVYKTFVAYRRENNLRRKSIQRETFKAIYAEIMKEIKKQFLENKAGIYLKGLGYFTVIMEMRPRRANLHSGNDEITTFNDNTFNRQFHPMLLTDFSSCRRLKYWYMDRLFVPEIRFSWAARLKKGDFPLVRFTAIQHLMRHNHDPN